MLGDGMGMTGKRVSEKAGHGYEGGPTALLTASQAHQQRNIGRTKQTGSTGKFQTGLISTTSY